MLFNGDLLPGQINLFFRVLSLAILFMITWLVLNNGNTFSTAALLTTVLGYHVQLTNAVLNTQI